MALGKGQFGTFFEKIAQARAQAQARDDAYAAQNAANPPPAISMDPGSNPADKGSGTGVSITPTPYGDMFVVPIIFPATGDLMILERPKNTRVLLIVYNSLAANPIYFAFGRSADNVSGVPIAPAGNLFLDVAVPQNDLHIFSPVAGTILLAYMNT